MLLLLSHGSVLVVGQGKDEPLSIGGASFVGKSQPRQKRPSSLILIRWDLRPRLDLAIEGMCFSII